MGKTLLLLLAGFAASFVILARGKDQRFADSVDRMVKQFSGATAKNATTSGAYMALNRLFLTPSWRGGYSNLVLGGEVLNVAVKNDSNGMTPKPHQVKILANAGNNLTEVVVFDSQFHKFAVWAKDTVISVVTRDSTGVANPDLLIQNAPFMPKIDKNTMVGDAAAQSHVYGEDDESHFHPADGFPNGSFYYDSTAISQVPNVIHVAGDLHIRDNRIVYGIYVVDGDVLLNYHANIRGMIYLPNSTSRVYNKENGGSYVLGGIVTWGQVDGNGYTINVKHYPKYLRDLVSNYAPDNPPLRVVSWK